MDRVAGAGLAQVVANLAAEHVAEQSEATTEASSNGVDLRRAGDVNPLICRG